MFSLKFKYLLMFWQNMSHRYRNSITKLTLIKFFIGPSTNANPQYKSQLSLETAEADATISSLLDSLKKDSSSSSKFQNIDAEKMSELFQISSSLTGNCLTNIMYLTCFCRFLHSNYLF